MGLEGAFPGLMGALQGPPQSPQMLCPHSALSILEQLLCTAW